MAAPSFDCVVVGGGPAGSALAGTLGRDGMAVLVVDDGRARHVMPVESLLPASVRVLQQSGIGDAVACAAVPGVRRHGAIWGSGELILQAEGEQGLAIERRAFDAALRSWALAAGAEVRNGCTARAIAANGCAVTLVDAGGAAVTVSARVVAVAAGRRVASSLVPLQIVERAAPLAAVCLVGTIAAAREDAADLAVVEAVRDGWLWWMPFGGGAVSLGVFVDGDAAAATGLHACVGAAVAAARGPARLLTASRLHAAVRATPRLCTTSCPVLLLGDAAATIDPLSSQGVAKAIAAADAAAAAVRTIVRDPGTRALALAHHAQWERGLFRAHLATAGAYYASERRFEGAPFWRARTAPPPGPSTSGGTAPVPRFLRRAPLVEERPGLRRAGPVLEPATTFAVAGDDEFLTHLGFVPVEPLLRAFAAPRGLEEGIALAGQDPRVFALPKAAVRGAVLALFERGFLTAPIGTRGSH